MSSIAWLDTSAEDERRMREIVRMFSDTSTLDDLGIGQVRDGLADMMFPGTSTIHARPRYFLIVPWLFQRAAAKYAGNVLVSKVNNEERRLIEVMRTPPAVDGMIGKRAGKSVRVLPSQIYWSALQRYGILDATNYRWNVPIDPPPGFPAELDRGLDLTEDEAHWLRERIMQSCPGTYLAYLLNEVRNTDHDHVDFPWTHPALMQAPSEIRNVVEHARLFSLGINGAALIYNLLIAERYDELRTGNQSYVEWYRDALAEWADEINADREALDRWDLDDFWSVVAGGRGGNRVGPATKIFVDDWFTRLRATDAHTLATTAEIRTVIAERERKNKGEQSRLANDRLIKNWLGASGARRLTYRWGTVHRMLIDIRGGLDNARA